MMFGRRPASLWRLSTPCLISPYKTNTDPSEYVSSLFVIRMTDASFSFKCATRLQSTPVCSRSQKTTVYGVAGYKAEMYRNRYSRSEMHTAIKSERIHRHITSGLGV